MTVLELTNICGSQFLHLFQDKGYVVQQGINVSSKQDPSVFLIGSTISVLKKHLLSNSNIPKIVLLQKAIRTQSLKKMEQRQQLNTRYGSYFISMGTLAPYSYLDEAIIIAVSYLISFGFESSSIMIRVNNSDNDMLLASIRAQREFHYLIEVNGRETTFYKHHYGLDKEKIAGRNINIAVLTKNNEWIDIANIIVIEKANKPMAIEFAMGMSNLISCIQGTPHTMLGNIIADIFEMKDLTDYWIGDCISVVSCLQNEGVIPNSSKMQGRLLKRYNNLLVSLCAEKQYAPIDLINAYKDYEKCLSLPI